MDPDIIQILREILAKDTEISNNTSSDGELAVKLGLIEATLTATFTAGGTFDELSASMENIVDELIKINANISQIGNLTGSTIDAHYGSADIGRKPDIVGTPNAITTEMPALTTMLGETTTASPNIGNTQLSPAQSFGIPISERPIGVVSQPQTTQEIPNAPINRVSDQTGPENSTNISGVDVHVVSDSSGILDELRRISVAGMGAVSIPVGQGPAGEAPASPYMLNPMGQIAFTPEAQQARTQQNFEAIQAMSPIPPGADIAPQQLSAIETTRLQQQALQEQAANYVAAPASAPPAPPNIPGPPTYPSSQSEPPPPSGDSGTTSGAMSSFMKRAASVGGVIAGGATAAATLPGIFGSAINKNSQMQQVRAAGYAGGNVSSSTSNTGLLSSMPFLQNILGNTLGSPGMQTIANSLPFGIGSAYSNLLSALGINPAQNTGNVAYVTALQDLYKSQYSNSPLTQSQISTALSLAQQSGYSYGSAVDPTTGKLIDPKTGKPTDAANAAAQDAYKKTLQGQFLEAELKVSKGTFGALDPTTIAPLLDLMFRKFGQSMDTTANQLLGFNTAAQAAQKSIVEYTAEVTQAAEALQQSGVTSSLKALDAAQVYASIRGIQAPAFESAIQNAFPFMLAMNPGKYTRNDIIAGITGNAINMPDQNNSQIPLQFVKTAEKLVGQFASGGLDQSSSIDLAAQRLGMNPGDLSLLLSAQNVKTITQAADLGTLTDQLMPKWGNKKGAAATEEFQQYLKSYNAAYGIQSKAATKEEQSIIAAMRKGETFGKAIDDLRAKNLAGTKANQVPTIGKIVIEVAPGTKIKQLAGSNGYALVTGN